MKYIKTKNKTEVNRKLELLLSKTKKKNKSMIK